MAKTRKSGHGRERRQAGSAMVEFVMLMVMVVVPVAAFLPAGFHGGGPWLLHALRAFRPTFCVRILVVIGLPLLRG